MNIPDDPDRHQIPEQAKGNPVYEQTRQDMPMWCCGRNCGRNSRIVIFFLGILGIVCSTVVCFSVNYFSFVSLRNDTFYDPDKQQPHPFEYATEANVGIFRYEIVEVYEYPWPPKEQERELFDDLHFRELERLAAAGESTRRESNEGGKDLSLRTLLNRMRVLQNDTEASGGVGENSTEASDASLNGTDTNATEADTFPPTLDDNFTKPPVVDLTPIPTEFQSSMPVPPVGPGSTAGEDTPTATPTSSPTMTNPNDLIDVDIGVVKPYPDGIGQFDQMFTNAQRGAMLAPIFAFIGLIFSCIEFCCCTYKCSWLPTAIFLYAAFMFQLMTMFLFMSEEFCKYDQDCALGLAGFLSVIAVLSYFICQNLVCCSPRPPPIYNCCKKPPVRRKKKKKKDENEPNDEGRGLTGPGVGDDDFRDEPEGYVDPYSDDAGEYVDPYDDNVQPDSYYSSADDPDSYYDPDHPGSYYDPNNEGGDGYGYDDPYAGQEYSDGDGYGDGSNDYTYDHGDYDTQGGDSMYSNGDGGETYGDDSYGRT
mmetsp:Transcript_12643/g.20368  ORF Transcript_12643/g.20368 Transcript_12643/m.20368 type:complete len:535 (+) Transcript_12643:133-1737(+)